MDGFNFNPFPLPMALAIYFTSWWISLFAVLPFGVKNHRESAESLPEGSDPGAPVAPNLLKKAFWTTIVAAIVFVGLDLYVIYLA